MKFAQALDLLTEGEKLRRWTWDKDIYLVRRSPKAFIMINNPGQEEVTWRPNQADVLGEDWEFALK